MMLVYFRPWWVCERQACLSWNHILTFLTTSVVSTGRKTRKQCPFGKSAILRGILQYTLYVKDSLVSKI